MSITFTGEVAENDIRKMFMARTPENSTIVVSVSHEALQNVGEQSALEMACKKYDAGEIDGL
ncbi:MAG: hypothetical protein AAF299_19940, partial [Pseudomonadota bacterium]